MSMDARERTEALVLWLREYGERHVRSRLWDERRCFPPHVVLDLARAGFFGMHVPEQYGGQPLPVSCAMRVVEQLAAIDTTLASFLGVNEALGVRPLARFGSEASKARYLPELAQGRMLAGLALTEAEAGSDPRGIRTRAERIEGGYRITGTKLLIGNGSWSGVTHVFARVDGGEFSGFTVPRDASGVTQGPEALTMGVRAMVQNELRLDGVDVDEEARLGRGLEALTDTLNYGRLGIAAMALGAMERAVQLAYRFMSRRRVATGLLSQNPDALDWLARSASSIELTWWLVQHLASHLERDEAVHEAWFLAAKIVVPEIAFEVIDGAMQRLGGRGYLEASGVPQLFRDARLFRIFEGPTEALASHLGASALAQPGAIAALMKPDRAARLVELVDVARDRLRSRRPDRRELAQRIALELGAWTAPALLGSLVENVVAAERAARAEARIRETLEGRASAFDAGAWVNDLRAAIGDVEACAAGAQHDTDPWLARTLEPLDLAQPGSGVVVEDDA